jgi:hypothetical protein
VAAVVENGLHPVIAAIERLVHPSYPVVIIRLLTDLRSGP